MKIVVLDGERANPGDLRWDCLAELGELRVYPHTAPAEMAARIGDSEIVIVDKLEITRSLLEACPSIKMIALFATGFNHIDVEAAKERGIPVCNVPAYGTDAVAQFTFALLLEICHQVGHHDRAVHAGRWADSPDFCFWDTPQMELVGKTIGIIGFGRIGRAVGRIARAFGMNVLAYNRSRCAEGAAIGEYVSLEDLLQRSDVVSLHCPLTTENRHMINKDTIRMMKDGAILLNTARGPLVDEQALCDALSDGKLRFAAADVAAVEPIPTDSPLLRAPNCILTPHMAWAPVESRQRILDCTVASIRAFMAGSPRNTVNGF